MSLQPAIKRAKKAIQDYLLNPENDKKREKALAEIENANTVSDEYGRRRYWRNELLVVPHYDLVPSSWYAETRETQWSIERMPDWARNGKLVPELGTDISGRAYTVAPKSTPR